MNYHGFASCSFIYKLRDSTVIHVYLHKFLMTWLSVEYAAESVAPGLMHHRTKLWSPESQFSFHYTALELHYAIHSTRKAWKRDHVEKQMSGPWCQSDTCLMLAIQKCSQRIPRLPMICVCWSWCGPYLQSRKENNHSLRFL